MGCVLPQQIPVSPLKAGRHFPQNDWAIRRLKSAHRRENLRLPNMQGTYCLPNPFPLTSEGYHLNNSGVRTSTIGTAR